MHTLLVDLSLRWIVVDHKFKYQKEDAHLQLVNHKDVVGY